MRIKLPPQKRFAIILVIILLWLTFAVEVIPSHVGSTASKGASVLTAAFAGAICLFDFFLVAFEAVDYWIDEGGISLYGFFGRIKLKTYSWDRFSFIGALPIKSRWSISNVEQMKIVCAKEPPRKRFHNSTAYVVNEIYGTIQFDYTEEILEKVLQYSKRRNRDFCS